MFEEVRIKGKFRLSSGAETDVYYAVEALKPCEVERYGDMIMSKIPKGRPIDCIVTPAYGGIPLACFLAHRMDLPLIIVKKDGTLQGALPDRVGANYLIVDDVVSTYAEIERVTRIMHQHVKSDPVGVACYIYRGGIERVNPPLYYLERKEEEV